jgi:CSLREA domain-containing protein
VYLSSWKSRDEHDGIGTVRQPELFPHPGRRAGGETIKTTSSTAMPVGRIAAVGFGLVVMVALLVLLAPRPAEAATTFTVNKTGDGKDRKINGVCDSSRKRGKQCTLRAAIQEANATSETDTINFNIGGTASVKTINVGSSGLGPLPIITNPVTIDGYSQGSNTATTSDDAKENTLAQGNDAVLKIQLNGTNAGAGSAVQGLTIRASGTTIKGLVINRFGGNGIDVQFNGGNRNRVEGNFIGTNASGTVDLGNGNNGVRISAENNLVGGTSTGARNIISGNEDDGVEIGSANENTVEGNFIGTNASGTAALGNVENGVAISNAFENTIGGTVLAARNVISGNGDDGVQIFGAGGTGNEVLGNFIGTTADGTGDLGNSLDGVLITGAPNNTIGGTASGAGNSISRNDSDGVEISGSGATGNKVEGNDIFSNDNDGVDIRGAPSNTIGGTASGAGNSISGNGDVGVEISGSGGTGNSVLSNSIFGNTRLGIDLGTTGVTPNDTDDRDTGGNNLQNFPVITSATQAPLPLGFEITIEGTLNSTPTQNFTVQCFLTGAPDGSGHGEGEAFKAEDTTVTTGTNGNASFECTFLFIASLEGQNVSATATNEATGDTSEFSQNVGVVAGS